MARLSQNHTAVFGTHPDILENDPSLALASEIKAIKECFRRADACSVNPEDLEALWIRRTEEAKMQGRETTGLVGLCSHISCNAAIA
jgi:hypothetical protein